MDDQFGCMYYLSKKSARPVTASEVMFDSIITDVSGDIQNHDKIKKNPFGIEIFLPARLSQESSKNCFVFRSCFSLQSKPL